MRCKKLMYRIRMKRVSWFERKSSSKMLLCLCYSMKFNGCNRNHDLYKLSSESSIHIHKYWMGNESVERTQLNSSPPEKTIYALIRCSCTWWMDYKPIISEMKEQCDLCFEHWIMAHVSEAHILSGQNKRIDFLLINNNNRFYSWING